MQREAMEQIALFQWIDLAINQYPELEAIYAIPNGGSRHKIEAANLKKQGVRAGVSDLNLPVPNDKYIGLWIEMKIKPRKLTEEQTKWFEKMTRYGHRCEVCYSSIEAIEVIKKYLK